ncbi:transcription factor tau 138 kDa subunit [[Candida] anglica]|uniref:Transcription factor tau 138 kDa subunit n=1 Tax=[Candida] anglica TaxID=148631 RepID=A0ABP0E7L6_9ASCO
MKYPPADIVDYVLEKAAYSGQYGVTLKNIWKYLEEFLEIQLDDFQKLTIWQWVFMGDEGGQDIGIGLYKQDLDIALPLSPDYRSFVEAHGTEDNLVIKPSPDTQWTFLTGLANSKRLKLQLGEFPFQLLCEIARNGPQGILAPDLSRNTNQDPRSLTPRLRKLEDLGLISKKNVYNEKSRQHTSLCIHKNFAKEEVTSISLDLNEDLESSRNVQKTKQAVMHAVKNAPNQLRGFGDLKVDLKLDKNTSSSKFFRGIVEYLDKRGYVERLMVKEADSKSMVYCIKFLKDLPKEYDENSELTDFFNALEEEEEAEGSKLDEEDKTSEEDSSKVPTLNGVFPLQNQLFEYVSSRKEAGATSMDIVKNITGVSDYRPYSKALDLFTTFVIDNDKLKSLRKYDDEYDKFSIIRGYDYEGKYKFYRYFTRESFAKISNIDPTDKKTKKTTKKPIAITSILALNKKHYTPLGRVMQASLLNNSKRKAAELDDPDEPRIERRGRPRKIKTDSSDSAEPKPKRPKGRPRKDASSMANTSVDLDSIVSDISVSLLEDPTRVESRESTLRSSQMKDTLPSQVNVDTINHNLEEALENNITSITEEAIVSSNNNLQILEDPIEKEEITEVKPMVSSPPKVKPPAAPAAGSLKAIRRRSALMSIIVDQGGITYTTANLCRLVDEKLGNATITDKKTLARDVSYLIATKELVSEDVSFTRSGQAITRKILMMSDPKHRPSKEKIEEVKEQCLTDNGKQQGTNINRRVIEDQVTLFNPTKKTETRLASLKNKTKKSKGEKKIKQENSEGKIRAAKPRKYKNKDSNSTALENNDYQESNTSQLESYLPKKRKTRPRQGKRSKPKSSENTSSSSQRYRVRGETKFDQSDATNLYRAVIISRSFRRGPIDFDSIAELFEDMSVNEVKRKWISVRKVVGGLSAVMRGIGVFERIITKGIEDGFVTTSDLTDFDYEFFLALWREADNSVLEGIDSNPFYSTIEMNREDYIIPDFKVSQQDFFDQLEDNSMRQKEGLLARKTFSYNEELPITEKKHDDLRTALKATFATSEENFSSQVVNNIFSRFGEEDTQEASTELLKDKEIAYFTLQESNTRFVLTDKFHNTLSQKVFSHKFFNQASQFESNFNSVTEVSKGLILSQGIASGEVAALINLLVEGRAKMTRVDRPYKFTGYESRLIDKSKLSCDIIVSANKGYVAENSTALVKIPIPTGMACSHIWLDLNGTINTKMWTKILISILYQVVFKPGISYNTLYRKFQTVLSVKDFKDVMSWLEKSNCILSGQQHGLFARNEWFSLLGH